MSKSEFLSIISTMTHEEIDEYFKRSIVRTKIIYPLVFIEPQKNDKKNKQITTKKEKK